MQAVYKNFMFCVLGSKQGLRLRNLIALLLKFCWHVPVCICTFLHFAFSRKAGKVLQVLKRYVCFVRSILAARQNHPDLGYWGSSLGWWFWLCSRGHKHLNVCAISWAWAQSWGSVGCLIIILFVDLDPLSSRPILTLVFLFCFLELHHRAVNGVR